MKGHLENLISVSTPLVGCGFLLFRYWGLMSFHWGASHESYVILRDGLHGLRDVYMMLRACVDRRRHRGATFLRRSRIFVARGGREGRRARRSFWARCYQQDGQGDCQLEDLEQLEPVFLSSSPPLVSHPPIQRVGSAVSTSSHIASSPISLLASHTGDP